MNVTEFISTLLRDKKVALPQGGLIDPRADLLPSMLAGAIQQTLPGTAQVHSGWQTQAMMDGWATGPYQCCLIVDDALVILDANVVRAQREDEVHDITVRMLPLHHVTPSTVLSYSRRVVEWGATEEAHLNQISLTIKNDGEAVSSAEAVGEDQLVALAQFIRHLNMGTERSRRQTSTGGGA